MYIVHILVYVLALRPQERGRKPQEARRLSHRGRRGVERPPGITIEDESSQGERRFVTVGANVFGAVMVVVWTERGENPRLISVRRAEPKERRAYEEGL